MTRCCESPGSITHYACQNEQRALQRLSGAGCILNRRIRKMIYHLGGKPLTGRRAVALRFSGRTEQKSTAQACGTAKAKEGNAAGREAGRCMRKQLGTERTL